MIKTDELLYGDIMHKLIFEPGLNADKIITSIKDGVVTLTGTVDNFSGKQDAVRVARKVKGTVAVIDKIDVKLADVYKRTDIDIAGAIAHTWKWNVLVPHEEIKATVRDGYVTLTGEVKWHFQREAAEKAIRHIPGIKGITHLITIKKSVLPDDAKQQIINEFERNAEINAKNIDAEIHNSEVILRGKVHSWEETKQAMHAAWSVPGISHVVNELVVESD